MKEYLKKNDRKVLELIDGCLTQREALEKIIDFFGDIPANLDIVCWVAFDALPSLEKCKS